MRIVPQSGMENRQECDYMIRLIQSKPCGISMFFRRDLKVETVSEVQMSSGRQLQRLGADRLKAPDPMVVRLADGGKSWMVEEDRRMREGV